LVCFLAVVAVAVSLTTAVQWPAAPRAVAAPVAASSPPVTVLPDLVSARLAAAGQGSRVEVSSLDSVTSTTWVNPDGTLTTDIGSQPVQAQDANGTWHRLDDTLRQRPNGTVVPRVAITGVVFGRDGSLAAAKLGSGSDSAAMHWNGPLPDPTLSGDTATYPGVYPGTDLTAQSSATGFELSLQVRDAAAAAALPDAIDLPLAGNGLTWSLQDGGVLVGTDTNGTAVVTSAGASAWDATLGAHTDEPLHSTLLRLSLTGPVGSQVLHVATPRDLLTDPATVFPVTIDPSATWSETAWTYVDSGYPNTSYYNAAGPAKVGTFDSGADKDRSLFRFGTAGLAGKHILSATFRIWEKWSWSCTPRTVDLWGVPGSFNSSTTWNNQPGVGVKRASITAAKGYDDVSCPAGSVSADVTDWVQVVADAGVSYDELELRAASETDNTYWKKFNIDPHVTVSYNSYPGTPGSLSVKPCTSQCSPTVLTNTTTPNLTGKTSDPDGGSLRYDFQVWDNAGANLIASGAKSGIASGSTATWTVWANHLSNGTTYKYRVRAFDGTDYGPWSTWLAFKVDTSAPATPTLSSTTWTAGTWSSATSGTISWSDSSTDVASYSWQLDGGTWSSPTTATSKSLSNLTNNKEHTFSVKATDKAGNVSAVGLFTFGVGTGGLTSPNDQDRTQRSVTLSAAGPQPYVAYQWRRGTTAAWVNIPLARVTDPTTGTSPTAWPVAIGASWNWDLATTAGNSDGLIQARACLYASTGDPSPTCQSDSVDVQLVTHTFGASYATRQVGPGEVSLLTGDYSLSATDAAITAYTGSLSVSRSFTTLAPAAGNSGATGVFGPGWTASLDGPDAGAAGETATIASDKSYVVLTDADGAASTYKATSLLTSSPISYAGLGDAADGSTLSYAYSLATPTLTLTYTDGTQTTWIQQAGQWVPRSVIQTGAAAQNTASFYYNGPAPGLPSRIVAASPAGINCGSETFAATTKGCRSLLFGYTQMTVDGGTVQRLTSLMLNAWNPNRSGGAGMDNVAIAAYDYDDRGRLAHVWDPRISPSLKTGYTYDANGRLATLTPPGLAAWSFGYDSTGCPVAATCGRLVTVSWPDPSGQTAVSTIVYGVPLSGAGLPDLTSGTTSGWGQDTDLTPQGGTPASAAIFGPDHVPGGTNPAIVPSTDWAYASISYLDVNGRGVDTAVYGAGAWQIDATRYNAQGNPVWSLAAGNRAQALTPTADTDPYVAALTDSADRADALATISSYNSDGTELVEQQGPAHPVTVTLADGSTSVVDARTDEMTCYDDMACNPGGPQAGGPYYLPVSVTTRALGVDGTPYDEQTSRTGYEGTTPNGSTGWTLRQATSQTDPGGLVTTTRYDDTGRVVETDLPDNGDNAAVRATLNTYYTTGTGPCGDDALIGLLCQTAPAGQPTSGLPLAVVSYGYDMYGNITSRTETAGSTVRTTTVGYDEAGRVIGTSIGVTPSGAGGTDLPAVTDGYDPNTGLPTTLSTTVNGVTTTLTTGYDSLARVTSYTDATGNTATMHYDLDGRLTSVDDGKGTTSYSYDSSSEHRGLVTGTDLGLAGAPSSFAVSYDAAGNPISETYPNGLVATRSFDNAGNLTSLDYSMAGTSWLEFDQSLDAQGRIMAQSSPASDQTFGYDGTGRLTTVRDITADPVSARTACTTRVYGFDNDSNRNSLNSYPDTGADPANGACATDLTPNNPGRVTSPSSFDQADRITNTGYTYDTLGRTTTVPATDATGVGSHAGISGDLSLAYYANDMVASETQAGQSITYTLDPAQNRIASSTDAGTTTTNHYIDDSDSPAWTQTGTGWTRNLLGPDGNLSGTIDQTGTATLDLVNPHGDVVAAVADDVNAVGPLSYQESTEFGQPRDPANAYDTYGWVGAHRRVSSDFGGMILMGVRLYNPLSGRFLSVDQIPGGNPNSYAYPSDPVNGYDLSGLEPAPARCTCTSSNVKWRQVAVWHDAPYDSWHKVNNFIDSTFVKFFTHVDAQIRHRHAHNLYKRCYHRRWQYKIVNYVQGQLRFNINFWIYTQTITSDWSDYHPRLIYAPDYVFYG
jgi:RHS repeat-associated protein